MRDDEQDVSDSQKTWTHVTRLICVPFINFNA